MEKELNNMRKLIEGAALGIAYFIIYPILFLIFKFNDLLDLIFQA